MVKTRDTSRLIVADETDAVLLFLTYGKDHAVAPRWITPGGGVDPGEDFPAAAIRELFEETGRVVTTVDPPFRTVDMAVDQRWHNYHRGTWAWFLIRTTRFTPDDANWMPDEHDDIVAHRWFAVDELEALPADADAPAFEPQDLPELIRAGLASSRGNSR